MPLGWIALVLTTIKAFDVWSMYAPVLQCVMRMC
jgi:hypothetical protein